MPTLAPVEKIVLAALRAPYAPPPRTFNAKRGQKNGGLKLPVSPPRATVVARASQKRRARGGARVRHAGKKEDFLEGEQIACTASRRLPYMKRKPVDQDNLSKLYAAL